jgi:branched-chain amino acid transport system permease protein
LTPPALGRVAGGAVGFAVLVILAAAPAFLPSYYLSVATRALIVAMFAVGFNIVFGKGGMPSLGHAAFFGAGGYAVGLGTVAWGWGLPTIVLAVLVVGAGLGLVFGVLAARVEGVYLLLLTLALAQALWGLAFQMVGVTRGDMGISGITHPPLPFPFSPRVSFYYLVLGAALGATAALWILLRSPAGYAIVGIRESASRMASLGYHAGAYKVCTFAASGVVSAVAGALYAYHAGFVGVENLSWILSATVLLAAILGGAATLLGPALGAVVLVALETWLGLHTARWMTVLGVVYLVTVLVLPNGLLGSGRGHAGSLRRPRGGLAADMPPDARHGT